MAFGAYRLTNIIENPLVVKSCPLNIYCSCFCWFAHDFFPTQIPSVASHNHVSAKQYCPILFASISAHDKDDKNSCVAVQVA